MRMVDAYRTQTTRLNPDAREHKVLNQGVESLLGRLKIPENLC